MIGELTFILVTVSHMVCALSVYNNQGFWQAAKQGDQGYIDEAIAHSSVNVNWRNPDDYLKEAPLHVAADGNWAGIIRSLLNAGADINLRDNNNQTALMDGSYHGSTEAVKELLAYGAEINAQDIVKQTALYKAAKRGYLDTAQALLDANADVNLANEDGRTPLHIAVENNNYDIVLLLLKNGADKRAKDKDGKIALDIANENRNNRLVDLLKTFRTTSLPTKHTFINKLTTTSPSIKRETVMVDPTSHLIRAMTTSHPVSLNPSLNLEFWEAAKRGDQAYIDKALATASVNVNWKNPNHAWSEAPIHVAADGNWAGIIKSLLNAGADINLRDDVNQTALMDGSYYGSTEAIKELLAHGAEVNAQDYKNQTALYKAAMKGFLRTAQALLNALADVNLANKDGKTPLHISAQENNYDIALLLLQHGADKSVKDKDGKTALDTAKVNWNRRLANLIETFGTMTTNIIDGHINESTTIIAVIKQETVTLRSIFSSAKASPTSTLSVTPTEHPVSPNLSDNLAFWEAAKRGDQAYIDKRIASASVNINWKNPDEYSETPLHAAADENNVGVIRSLLNAGADIELRDENNQTALIDATYHGSTEAIKELLSHGADVDAQDKWKRTALYIAAEFCGYDAALFLLQHGADKNIKDEDDRTALDRAKACYDKKIANLIETFEPTSKPTVGNQKNISTTHIPTTKPATVSFKLSTYQTNARPSRKQSKVTFKPTADLPTGTPPEKLTRACPNKSASINLEPIAEQTSACVTNKPASSNMSLYWYIIIIIGFILGIVIITTIVIYTRKFFNAKCKPQGPEYAKFVNSDNRVSLNIYEISNVKNV